MFLPVLLILTANRLGAPERLIPGIFEVDEFVHQSD
jgi:hypothetical protein